MALPSPLEAFIWGPGGAALTPEQIARQRDIADALLAKAGDTSPVASWTQGAARIADALSGKIKEARLDKAEAANATTNSGIIQALLGGGMSGFPAAPSAGTVTPSASAASGATDYHGDQLAWTDAAPYQKAFLNTLAGPESGGRYNVIYGGGTFDDYSHHPNQAVRIQTGPNAGRTSSAAGKYQFLGSTWDQQAKELGLTDFSPVNQDKAAWNLAAETYKAKTGQDLGTVLQSGDPAQIATVGKVLSPVWTSLPSGIEQGTTTDRFVASYQRALGAGASPEQAKAVAQQTTQPRPVQVASLDPSAGMAPAADPLTAMAPGTSAPAYDPSGLPPLDPNDPMAPVSQPKAGIVQQTTAAAPSDGGYVPGAPATQTEAGQRVLAALTNPQPIGGAPMPMQGAPQAAPVRVAQAAPQDLSQLPVTAGGTADAIPAGQARGISPAIIDALSNPAASPQTQKIAQMLLAPMLDPNAGLETEYKRAQIKNIESEIAKRNDPNARDKFGNNPVWGKDKNGKWVLFQLNNAGGLAPAAPPDGIDLVPPGIGQMDLGTSIGIRDRAGAMIGNVPKDLAGAESEKASGKAQGEAAFDLPRVEQNAQQSLDVLERMKNHPGRTGSTGFIEGMLPSRTSDQVDFQSLVDQTQGQTFLQAFQMLKGSGQITDIEGKKATDAISRLRNQRLSDDDYLRAITDLEDVVKTGLERARKQAGAASSGAPSGDQKRLKFNPTTGELE